MPRVEPRFSNSRLQNSLLALGFKLGDRYCNILSTSERKDYEVSDELSCG